MSSSVFERVLSKPNRNLLAELVRTDFKVRYQGSVLGYLWSLLKPLALFAILFVVFDQFLNLGRDIEHFPLYLLMGIVLWGFFTESTTLSMGAVVENGELIRKITIPKYLLVISRTINASINLAFNLAVVAVFMLVAGVDVGTRALLFIPILFELYVISLALGFLLSALYVKYRDMSFIWEVILQGAFYATPILYPLSFVPDEIAKWLLLNPLAQIIQDARYALITDQTGIVADFWSPVVVLLPFGLVALIAVVSAGVFRRASTRFAEEV